MFGKSDVGSAQVLAAKILALVLSLPVALLLGELAVRIVAPQPAELQSRGLYVPDASVGYRLAPGHVGFLGNRVEFHTTVRINETGLRGGPIADKGCALRVLVLGDSFVFGQGVEVDQALAARLQEELGRGGREVQVLNAGVRGYSTTQEVAWLERYGLALQPDLVVLGVYLGNDLLDNRVPPAERLRQPGAAGGQGWLRDNIVTRTLYRRSHLYALVRGLPGMRRGRTVPGLPVVVSDELLRNYGGSGLANLTEETLRTREAVARFAALSAANGAAPFAVLIPEWVQVAPWRGELAAGLQRQGTEIDWSLPNRIFTESLRDSGVPLIDLTPLLAEDIADGAPDYFAIDHHWTAEGHAAAADWVARAMEASVDLTREALSGCTPP